MALLNTDLAYIAGIIDGEGCIRILKMKDKKREGIANYTLQLEVASTDEWLCRYLWMHFKGSVYKDRWIRTPKASPTWRWRVYGQNVANLLEEIMPFLKLKHQQALLAREFQSRKAPRGHSISEGGRAVEEAQFILMSNLKQRKLTLGRDLQGRLSGVNMG